MYNIPIGTLTHTYIIYIISFFFFCFEFEYNISDYYCTHILKLYNIPITFIMVPIEYRYIIFVLVRASSGGANQTRKITRRSRSRERD